jgi:hypothetical protein
MATSLMTRVLLVVFFAFGFSTNAARAQSTNAAIGGQITDEQGRVVPGATVILTNLNTGVTYSARTNGDGIYSAPALPPGIYRANVTKDGFKSIVKSDIELHVQDVASINFQLQVGSVSETVTVEAGGLVINTTDATVSTVVNRQFAENLPMNGRSFQTLIELTPGVVQTPSEGQFSVNGQRGTSNYWMVDGVSANFGISSNGGFQGSATGGAVPAFSQQGGTNSLVSVDALQEFRVQTSTSAPEFGRTPGAQISIETRSGTNQFHGTAFDYFRNDVLDAKNWFNGYTNSPPLPKAEDRQNDFGGVLGGPIIKNKTFFFFSYEGLRLRLPNTMVTTVPSLSARQSAIAAMQPVLDAFPLPNPGAPDNNGVSAFSGSYSDPSTLNATSLRIDHRVKDNFLLFGRYDYSPSGLSHRSFGAEVDTSRITIQTATVGATWTITPASTNDLRFNYSRSDASGYSSTDNFGGAVPLPASALPLPSSFTLNNSLMAYRILSGPTTNTLIEGNNGHNLQRQINLVDNLSIQEGSHRLKFGVDYRRLSPVWVPASYVQQDVFLDVADAASGTLTEAFVNSARNATFLLRNLGLFAQDSWRVMPRLTVTYGLRWDVDFTPTTTSGPNFPAVTNFGNLSQLALAPAGRPPYNTKFGNVAPRLGVAYQLSQKPGAETVVRGGWGIFYDLASQAVGTALLNSFYPFGAQNLVFGQYPLDPSTTAAPPSISVAQLASGGVLAAFDPNLKLPYTMQWNVAIERSLGTTQSLSATYLGSVGRRLLQTEVDDNINQNISNAYLVSNQGTSDYNALQLQFQRRVSHGLQALASYTWAHSIDTASDTYTIFARAIGANPNRGSSDFDVRHAVSVGITYDIPAPRINAFANAIVRGWSLENVFQAWSAPPVNLIDPNVSLNNSPLAFARPDVVPGIPLYLFGSQYPGGKAINNTPGAVMGGCPDGSQSVGPFCPPPVDPTTGLALRQGDLGRNALRGFGAWQWDLAVHRNFPIRDSLALQFRAEMFNVLNHPNFGPPDGNIGDTLFGLSTRTLGKSLDGGVGGGTPLSDLYQIGGPRSIQLALKLIF